MNSKRLLAVLASVCLALLAQSVSARGFSYSYVEGGYRNVDADSFEADGAEAGFSFGALEYMHILGSYSHLWVDSVDGLSSIDLDMDEFKIGFGGHYPILDRVDLVLDAVYVDEEINGKARPSGTSSRTRVNEDEEGYEATFSARVQALKQLEMTPHVTYRDVGSESDTGFGLGLVYNFYKKFSLRIKGTHFSDDSATDLFLGMRVDL
jgi:hypothetical protein